MPSWSSSACKCESSQRIYSGLSWLCHNVLRNVLDRPDEGLVIKIFSGDLRSSQPIPVVRHLLLIDCCWDELVIQPAIKYMYLVVELQNCRE